MIANILKLFLRVNKLVCLDHIVDLDPGVVLYLRVTLGAYLCNTKVVLAD
jgi:hypothetical protein